MLVKSPHERLHDGVLHKIGMTWPVTFLDAPALEQSRSRSESLQFRIGGLSCEYCQAERSKFNLPEPDSEFETRREEPSTQAWHDEVKENVKLDKQIIDLQDVLKASEIELANTQRDLQFQREKTKDLEEECKVLEEHLRALGIDPAEDSDNS